MAVSPPRVEAAENAVDYACVLFEGGALVLLDYLG